MDQQDRDKLKKRLPKGWNEKAFRLLTHRYSESTINRQMNYGRSDHQLIWNVLFILADEEDARKEQNAIRANGQKVEAA